MFTSPPGRLGGVRGLAHCRVPLQTIGAHVYPEILGLPRAHQAFDASGDFLDRHQQARLQDLLLAYIAFAAKLSTPRDDARAAKA